MKRFFVTPAVILGSAFESGWLDGRQLSPVTVRTRWGEVDLHSYESGYVSFRHGQAHRLLPHQISYRAQAAALAAVGCDTLLVTSSVGVLDPGLPLYAPLLVSDLVMLENRLPDGTLCTMFPEPCSGQGHLVIEEGLFSQAIGRAIQRRHGPLPEVSFAYVPGPRTKTTLENRLLSGWGIQTNSMTVGPEVVLANELQIPTAAVVVGHKPSCEPVAQAELASSLKESRSTLERIAVSFLNAEMPAPPWRNQLFQFGAEEGW